MNRSKNNLRFVSGTLLIIGAIAVIFLYAPGYLQYADKPGKSDCVILLLGPNTEARKKEAVQLIKDGYADLLIIPANNKILTASPEKSLQTKKVNPPLEEIDLLKKTNFPVENTNIEILLARKIMDRFSFRSATFVSSPYHMRRIKMLCEDVFDLNTYDLSYVPSRYEETHGTFWIFDATDLKWIASEYAKIVWFMVYNLIQ